MKSTVLIIIASLRSAHGGWLVSFPLGYFPHPTLAHGTIECLSEAIDCVECPV